jgi:glycosyltransferase involved in cell wall biosynthesis
MTVRNGMPYLEEAVRCILRQTRRDFTFLILNNASSDGTRAFLDGTAAEHGPGRPRLILRHLSADAGRTGALSLGLEAAETELVAVMDADDLCRPDRLERQSAFLALHPETDILGSDVDYVDAAGAVVARGRFPTEHEGLRDMLPLSNPFANSACMFRAAAARAAGGYDLSFPYAQDSALWTAMMRKGSRAASIGDFLTGIRVHAGQATRDRSLLRARLRDDCRIALSMLTIPGLSAAARQAALARAACAMFRLGERGNAVKTAWRALLEAPLLCFRNPLLLLRVGIELRRRIRKE